MLSGFNTNFRYRGVLFHVQTEDSGRENPHVITHLFHGGNILASEKRDYSDRLGEADVEHAVRKLMESQHKSMLKRLSRGEHDAVLRDRLGAGMFEGDGSAGAAASPTDAASGNAISGATSSPAETDPPTRSTPEPAPPVAARRADPLGLRGGTRPPTHTEPTGTLPPDPLARSGGAPARGEIEDPDVPDAGGDGGDDDRDRLARVFGEKTVSERPLDEVVLDYLVENARKRKRSPK